MADKDKGSDNGANVDIDIGLSAKAELSVKTEVPAEVTGNILTHLTDIIRPFTEQRGLKADHLRLQREEVLIEIAKLARQRAEIENLELKPVPNKFLVPFLELASLEELESELLELWATLLLHASNEYEDAYAVYLDVLAKLTPGSASCFGDGGIFSNFGDYLSSEIMTTQEKLFLTIQETVGSVSILETKKPKMGSIANHFNESISDLIEEKIPIIRSMLHVELTKVRVITNIPGHYITNKIRFTRSMQISDVGNLCRLNVLKECEHNFSVSDETTVFVSWCELTEFGRSFVSACMDEVPA